MTPNFKVGDKVEVLDDSIKGVVEAVKGNRVEVLLEDGFSMEFDNSEIVRIGKSLSVTNYEAAKVKKVKEAPQKKKASQSKAQRKEYAKNGSGLTYPSISEVYKRHV